MVYSFTAEDEQIEKLRKGDLIIFTDGDRKGYGLKMPGNFGDFSRLIQKAIRWILKKEYAKREGSYVGRLVTIDLEVDEPREGVWYQDGIAYYVPTSWEKALENLDRQYYVVV